MTSLNLNPLLTCAYKATSMSLKDVKVSSSDGVIKKLEKG